MKEFNITGTCIPEEHYMVDTSLKLNEIMKFVEKRKYFTINRPRQYGKTTMMYLLDKRLKNNKDYFLIRMSFEGMGNEPFESEEVFSKTFIEMMADKIENKNKEICQYLYSELKNIDKFKDLSKLITKLIKINI